MSVVLACIEWLIRGPEECQNIFLIITRKNNRKKIPVNQLEDATFQLYKDGDYGNYLDVEASINEQAEELEGFLEK